MLTTHDFRFTYLAFSFFSKLNLLPYSFDASNGLLEPIKSSGRQILWSEEIGLVLLHYLIQSIRFLRSFGDAHTRELLNVSFHLIILIGQTFGFCWSYATLWNGRVEVLYLHNSYHTIIHERLYEQSYLVADHDPKNLRETFLKYLCIPHALMVVFFVVLCILAPDMTFHAQSLIPPPFRSWLTTALVLVPETYVIIFWAAVSMHYISLNILFFEMCRKRLEAAYGDLNRMKERKRWTDQVILGKVIFKRISKIVLEINLYNQLFAGANVINKCLCLTMSTCSIFLGVYFFSSDFAFSFVLLFLGFYNPTFYVTFYSTAFVIPTSMTNLKEALQVTSAELGMHGAYFSRVAKSIPACGIKCGMFHVFQRNSNLLFFDFVAGQVVNLLVVYR